MAILQKHGARMGLKGKHNSFLVDPIGVCYLKTAIPIIFVMLMNGLMNMVDAYFLGHFVGPDALAAVTLVFPINIIIGALATLVTSGMASLLARELGAGNDQGAMAVFASAHILSFLMSLALIILFFIFGETLMTVAAGQSKEIAELGMRYITISVFFAPLLYILVVNSEALRCEDRTIQMAMIGAIVTIANIAANYILVGIYDFGVSGSAYSTTIAHIVALSSILFLRKRKMTKLSVVVFHRQNYTVFWARIVALGVHQSLGLIGMSLSTAATITAIQMFHLVNSDTVLSAYGLVTRIMFFAFLSVLGLSQAMQSITGNNYGAGHGQRTDESLRCALWSAGIYCAAVQFILMAFPARIGGIFIDELAVIAEISQILPIISLGFVLSGPLILIAMHFQAIGDAKSANILGLAKPFCFLIPLTFILPFFVGQNGIWLAAPAAEICLLALTLYVGFKKLRMTPMS